MDTNTQTTTGPVCSTSNPPPPSYDEIINAVKDECSKINLTYSTEGDGRLTSAIKETEYLTLLEKGLSTNYPKIQFETQPVERWWWDFRVNNIPFNLKISTGGTDNAFNKVAIIYTITGKEVVKRNMNFNLFFKLLQEMPKKTERDEMTEYHYLVVNKNDGRVLLKSILDIYEFKSNPCNYLQINWANEFKHMNYMSSNISLEDNQQEDDESNQNKNDMYFKEKIRILIKTIQTSIKKSIESMNLFANANIDEEFPI